MYGRACRNLSLWRKYKTNIDTLLLIFAFFNEEGSSDIQYRSRSRRGLGKNLITDKDREEMRRKLASGEMVIVSNDDLSRPYYPLVPLKKVQDDLRRMMAETEVDGE